MANILQLKGSVVDGEVVVDVVLLDKFALKEHTHEYSDQLSDEANFDDAEGDPANVSLSAAVDGSSSNAARRDHVHLLSDGPGSGLDADTVDGSHAAAFATSAHTHEVDERSDMFSDAEGDPANVSSSAAADGTSTYAARRDHVHLASSSGDLEVDENLYHRQDNTTRVRFFGADDDKVAIYAGGEAYILVEGGSTDTVSIGDSALAVTLLTDVLIAKTGGLVNIASNLAVNGDPSLGSSTGVLALRVGTAPTSSPANNVQLYSEDVSASAELKVRDEAANVTTLSPHNFEGHPDGPSEEMAWSYHSERDGKRIVVDMLRVVRLLEELTGEKLVWISEA